MQGQERTLVRVTLSILFYPPLSPVAAALTYGVVHTPPFTSWLSLSVLRFSRDCMVQAAFLLTKFPLPGPRSVERGGDAAYPINASTMVLRSTRRGRILVEPNRTKSTHDRHNFLLTWVDEPGIQPPCFGHGPVALHIRHSLFHQEATTHPPLTCCTLLPVNSAKSPFAT